MTVPEWHGEKLSATMQEPTDVDERIHPLAEAAETDAAAETASTAASHDAHETPRSAGSSKLLRLVPKCA